MIVIRPLETGICESADVVMGVGLKRRRHLHSIYTAAVKRVNYSHM